MSQEDLVRLNSTLELVIAGVDHILNILLKG